MVYVFIVQNLFSLQESRVKHLIFSLLALSGIANAMILPYIPDHKERLTDRLRDITFNGNYDAFIQQDAMFYRGLEHSDILHAQRQCDARLVALEYLKNMYADTRIKELVFTMQAEMKTSNMGLFAYIDDAEKKYKQDETPEQEHIFGTAAEILRSIELRKTSYTGNYLINIQEKIAQAQNPFALLATETNNTQNLQWQLKQLLRNKIGYQLHQIVFDGNVAAFEQKQELFKKELEAIDLVRAKENCSFRLFAVENITKMRTNPRFNLLVMSMEQDEELRYIDMLTSFCKYKKDYSAEEVKAALEVYYATCPNSAVYNGCFADIQEKIEHEQNPEKYLEQEKQNILQLRDALQKITPDAPEELMSMVHRQKTLKFTKDYFSLAE